MLYHMILQDLAKGCMVTVSEFVVEQISQTRCITQACRTGKQCMVQDLGLYVSMLYHLGRHSFAKKFVVQSRLGMVCRHAVSP